MRHLRPWYKTCIIVVLVLCLFIYGYRRWTEERAWRTAIQVPVGGFQPGTAKLTQGLWIARQTNGKFWVFLDRSDFNSDRPLRWVEADLQFEEPISSARYDMNGLGQFGPARQLYRVDAQLSGHSLLILPTRIISGGPGEPAWLQDLRRLLFPPPVNPPDPTPTLRP